MAKAAEPHLPPEVLSHLRGLLDSYARLRVANVPANTECDRQVANIKNAIDTTPEKLWWTDVATAELCIIGLLADEDIRARVKGWRRRLHEVIGDARYAAYLSAAPDPDTATPPKVAADLSECIRTVYYFYAAYGLAAHSRAVVGTKTVQVGAIIILIEGLIALLLSWSTEPEAIGGHPVLLPTAPHVRNAIELLLATSAMAVVGSVVSVQRRLQDPALSADPFFVYIQMRYDRFSVAFVSPLFGAIFGAVAYGLVFAGLIADSIVKVSPDTGLPEKGQGYALILLLGFLSGFAESFVPDALTQVAARVLGSRGPAIPTPPAPVPTTGGIPSQGAPTPATDGVAAAPRRLASTPSDVTPQARVLGQDATLASEASTSDDARGGS